MSAVLQLSPVDVGYFGGCPKCGRVEKWRNIGKTHWACCDSHGVKWCVGTNLFSSWGEETAATWDVNEAVLANFSEVEPMPSGKRMVCSTAGGSR
jgi:hypothetical protein